MGIIFVGYLAAINVIAFVMYGLDKWKAKNHQYRIPEKTLIGIAVIGGSVGAWMGMQMFRHKTKHPKFVIGIPTIVFIQVMVAMAIEYFYGGLL